MHDDVGIDGFSQMIVGRDDRAARQAERPLAEPVVVAIDLPARKMLLDVDREAVGQRALAEIPARTGIFRARKTPAGR